MPKKKQELKTQSDIPPAEIADQPITETIEQNYMPYVMSVIVSRAIPEIDGFKPSQRKLLYTMYKMGLLTGGRTKSANVVGQTMRLNPHGDMAIYETMVRLTRGNEALLHPFVDSKGSFGKQYSRDMAFAAPRYTEVKLDAFCTELFTGIDKNAVELVPNYDNTMKEPTLLPTTFPNILVSPNLGIAVGMASQICSFNLAEICDGTVELLKNPDLTTETLMEIVKAPDFSGGASLLYDREQLREIYETGRGNLRLRAKYGFDKVNGCIEIKEIPYSTSIEAILKAVSDLVRDGKIKEITDFRDEIDLSGFKLTLDVRRGTNPDALMAKLFRLTPLEDSFACNFNVLIDGVPRQLGVVGILKEWVRFRQGCLVREMTFDLARNREKLHLLEGLQKILADIDKAIRIVRETEKEEDVVPNLMAGFSIDSVQAEYIAEIKLRHLNREYIIERTAEISALRDTIAELEENIASEQKQRKLISNQLKAIKKKYGKPRRTEILYEDTLAAVPEENEAENYPVHVFLTREGYFKKIMPQSLRIADDHRLKEGDEILYTEDVTNRAELLVFTNMGQVYKAQLDNFKTTKASALGEYLPAFLGFEENEKLIFAKAIEKYDPEKHFIFIFENGKAVRIPETVYETKNNRKKLTNAYSTLIPAVKILYEAEPTDLLLLSDAKRAILLSSAMIPQKTTRTAAGTTVFALKEKKKITDVLVGDAAIKFEGSEKCRIREIPATGVLLRSAKQIGME